MPFQIKSFNDIVLSEINHGRAVTEKVTDWAPGSVARTIIEAPAVEIEELYLQMFLGLRDAIPVATFLSFGFDRLPAARAHGFVSISKETPQGEAVTIDAGSLFSTEDGRQYESTAQVVWPAGASLVRVPVVATVAGLSGNVAAGVINTSTQFSADAGYVVSNSLIETGRDVETDLEREARFSEFVQSLSRGTVVACLYAARSARVLDEDGNIFEFVTRAGLSEEPGSVRIYVYSNRGVPSAELLADGQLRMDGSRDDEAGTITPGVRSAGVQVDVLPMAERVVPGAIQVEMVSGASITPAVVQALTDVYATAITGVQPGSTLYIGTLVELLLSVPNVRTVVPAASTNITCSVDEALVPGALTVTPL